MARRIALAAFVGGLVMALAAPAHAKGIAEATISGGPGVPPGGISIRGDDEGLYGGGLLEDLKDQPPMASGIFRSELGPAYRMSYVFVMEPHKTVLHQIVYPYAPGGAWTFTPRGQELCPTCGTVAGGWWAASEGFENSLFEAGLPQRNPVDKGSHAAVQGSAEDQAAKDSGGIPLGVWAAVALAAGVALIVAGNLAVQARRRARVS